MHQRGLWLSAAWVIWLAGSLAAQGDPVRWITNYQDAIEEAKRTQKPIFLEFRCEP